MGKLYAIGELLIDFIPHEKGCELKKVVTFDRTPGGAPANVAACVSKFNIESHFIGKVGKDAFGEFLIDTLKEAGVGIEYVTYTNEANTALAFVSLAADGNRDFSFYRNPSADMLLEADEIPTDAFEEGDILHFCSVDLIEAPVKYAHIKAIDAMKAVGGKISFDPNLRFPLWKSKEELRATVQEFIPKANILKVSDEELEFITGIADEEEAIKSLFVGDVEYVIYTLGPDGARIYTKDGSVSVAGGYKVDVVDTTGAGDAFIGGFLYRVLEVGYEQLGSADLRDMIDFANKVGAYITSKKGVIHQLPTLEDIRRNF